MTEERSAEDYRIRCRLGLPADVGWCWVHCVRCGRVDRILKIHLPIRYNGVSEGPYFDIDEAMAKKLAWPCRFCKLDSAHYLSPGEIPPDLETKL